MSPGVSWTPLIMGGAALLALEGSGGDFLAALIAAGVAVFVWPLICITIHKGER